MADIGGLLGLFIGVSVCSAMELVEFFVDLTVVLCKRCKEKKKLRNKTAVTPLPPSSNA